MLPYFVTVLHEGFPLVWLTAVFRSLISERTLKPPIGRTVVGLLFFGGLAYQPLVTGKIILETRLALTGMTLAFFLLLGLLSFASLGRFLVNRRIIAADRKSVV